MRIIAGIARGRRLAAPKGTATRPTSDRAREGLFATVTAIRGPLPWPARYRADRSRRYGEATFWYGLAAAEAS